MILRDHVGKRYESGLNLTMDEFDNFREKNPEERIKVVCQGTFDLKFVKLRYLVSNVGYARFGFTYLSDNKKNVYDV